MINVIRSSILFSAICLFIQSNNTGQAWSQDSTIPDSIPPIKRTVLGTQEESKLDTPARKNEDAELGNSILEGVPSPKEIINRYIDLVGGYEAIESIESVYKKANASHVAPTRFSEFESFYSRGLYAETYTFSQLGNVFVRVLRDGVGWEGYQGHPNRVYYGEELKGYLFRAEHPFRCTRWMDDCKSIKYAGMDEVKGKKVYVLQLEFKNGYKFKNSFEIESGLHVRSVSREFYNGKMNHCVSTVLETERDNGILMTKKLEIVRAGKPIIYEYTELEIDLKIPEEQFDYPDAMDKDKMVELQAKMKEQDKRVAEAQKLSRAMLRKAMDKQAERMKERGK